MVNKLNTLIPKLAGQRILVIGDVILDEYLIGKTTRLSREAPVPVLEFEARHLIPGGAANPAANITALGSTAVQIGVIGADTAATSLRQELQVRGIDTQGLITDASRPTTVKTRVMAQMGLRFPQQVARLDTLSRAPISLDVQQRIAAFIGQQVDQARAVLVSDYQCGLLTDTLVDHIRESGRKAGTLLAADAQGQLDKYHAFDLVKCNADEAQDYLGHEIQEDAGFAEAALELCSRLRLSRCMVITRGASGATVATPDGQAIHCPSPRVIDVYDTVGAGDTAITILTLAVVAGASPADAATLANHASGIVVRHVGNYAPTPEQLLAALDNTG